MIQRDSEAGSAFSPVAAASSAASSGMVMSAFSATCAQKKRPMRFELGVASTAARLGFEASPRANRPHQLHHEGNRHLEMRRSGAPRMTIFDKADNPLTQIKRIGLWHRESPPNRSESRITSHWNPSRFNVTVRRSSACANPASDAPTRSEQRGDFSLAGWSRSGHTHSVIGRIPEERAAHTSRRFTSLVASLEFSGRSIRA